MKQSYNIEVAGVNLNIVSSDGAEFVENTVAELEASVENMLRIGKNYSKLDALILCALDYLGEYRKAEAKIKNLEAQVEILEANRRTKADVAEEAPAAAEEPAKAEEPAVAEKPAVADVAPEKAEAEVAPAEEKSNDTDSSSRDAKFRQLEAFLGSQLKMDLDK